MEIRGGKMYSHKGTPYTVNRFVLADLISLFSNMKVTYFQIADSLVLVDGTYAPLEQQKAFGRIILSSENVYITLNQALHFTLPYASFIKNNADSFFIEKKNVQKALLKAVPMVLFLFCIRYTIFFLIVLFFSIFLLSTAALIFRMNRPIRYGLILKICSFAVSPVIIGIVLKSLSGNVLEWAWEFSFMISLYLVFRALYFVTAKQSVEGMSEDRV